jgi:SAM-dependent methyltransferase
MATERVPNIAVIVSSARYDDYADWYDAQLARFTEQATPFIRRWLGAGAGRCLDLGCGGGVQLVAVAELGWSSIGLDVSHNQLRIARDRRGVRALVQADATRAPFVDESFDAVVAGFVHTDVDDWPGAVDEVRRILRPGGCFIYVGTHPCFVGPFSRYVGQGPPVLHRGYRRTERTYTGPGLGKRGVWRRVGGRHIPLAVLLQTLIDTGLRLEHIEEPGPEDYPRILAFAARRGEETNQAREQNKKPWLEELKDVFSM